VASNIRQALSANAPVALVSWVEWHHMTWRAISARLYAKGLENNLSQELALKSLTNNIGQAIYKVGRRRLKPVSASRNKTSLACMTYCPRVMLCDLTRCCDKVRETT
jgi:hypothetical protein